ncbi:MAG: hydantoinase B/oxoprolinase family protein [Paenibacillus sp.]|jgi:N-methylhydantoinase B|nr:hydantoinase B/oxoprolinase family protein [Paenibacillus sp.]
MVDTTAARPPRKIDPIQYEILRHRLQSITEEAATAMKRVSGSPVATEIGDLNVAIMNRDGECVLIGQYIVTKGSTLSCVVKDVLANYQENPGIQEGDGFLCNDPYIGIMHQNDIALVMPVFYEGELVAWVGAEIHQIDVGGPTPGQVQLGAKDIYGEAPLMPSIKVLQNGVLLADVERNYLRKSRVPDLLALDLRAKLAACNTLIANMLQLAERLGKDGLTDFLEEILNDAELLLRAKLRKIPDGSWYSRAYMEFDDNIYPIVLKLSKSNDSLHFDFTGTAKQAPATINITFPSLEAMLSGTLVSTLCWDIPWTTSGVARTISIHAESGTLVNPNFPAGVSKSTTSIGLLIMALVGNIVSKMLLASGTYTDRAMGGWPGSKAQEELNGVNQFGVHFGADILDGMAGGGGARTFKDGIDTGGLVGAAKSSISNIEQYELEYPILYLYRKQLADSGGAGMFRGGNGIDRMYVVHDVEGIPDVIMHSMGSKVPATVGIAGGHPSATNQFYIKRNALSDQQLAQGELPASFEEVAGEPEIHGNMSHSSLNAGDVYRSISNGGGGYGDPLRREPSLVLEDIAFGRITASTASEIYGVAIVGTSVDLAATEENRAAKLAARRADSDKPARVQAQIKLESQKAKLFHGLLIGIGEDGHHYFYCECGCTIAPHGAEAYGYMARADKPARESGKYVDPYGKGETEFLWRTHYCPHCYRQFDSSMIRIGDDSLPSDHFHNLTSLEVGTRM